MNLYRGIIGVWAVSCVTACVLGVAQADNSPRLLFWQPQDIVDAQNVRCTAQPIVKEAMVVLLRPDARQETLWYMPTAALPIGTDVRVYYQRVEKGQAKYEDQRTFCLGILRGREFVVPELVSTPRPGTGHATWSCSDRRTHPRGVDSMCSRSWAASRQATGCCIGISRPQDRRGRCWLHRLTGIAGRKTIAAPCSRSTTTLSRWCTQTKVASISCTRPPWCLGRTNH